MLRIKGQFELETGPRLPIAKRQIVQHLGQCDGREFDKQIPEQESCDPLQFPFARHVRPLDPCNFVKPILQLTRQVVL